ncbi:hypothetical protein HYH02_011973 [Chlamydomonas schloesseri]|uniref:TFIIS central domain-containing protein n=1 Tax=Chlamydomonas schloesseri TaxID=2026947 RepID=A0A835T708_9CHLO|nr:hypothetical protein HYH02_011973 [Chlamydomonas schloesseri]|eukprot:KAG2434974.1 hypothetical protein HYH02_011973 [Chlamydomonas schloesseri]
MAQRERRSTAGRPPAKYAESDDYYESLGRSRDRPLRQVYRLLKHKDVRKDLVGQEVHVYWPEDQQWYRATVEEVATQQPDPTAYLHYPDTDEYEDINLNEVIESQQIAVIEGRSLFAKLKRDEIPVNVSERLTAVYEDDDEEKSSDPGSDGGQESEDGEPRMLRDQHKQVQRSKRPRESTLDRPGSAKKQTAGDDGGGTAGGDADMAEAEAFKNNLINALMHNIGGPAGPPPGMIPTPGSQPPMLMIPTPGGTGPGSARGTLKQQSSLPSASSVSADEEVRAKVREQLGLALQRAMDELKAEGYTEALPVPTEVATEVELELYKLHESSVSKEYKAKFRSLAFNLKDNANPELRARVLRRELAPATLVTLGPAELARKELSEWRKKREEEAAKAVFLDAETAAKYSTAAAAALAQSRLRAKDDEVPAVKPTASPERRAEPAHEEAATGGGDGGASLARLGSDSGAALAASGGAAGEPGLQRRISSGLPRLDSANASMSISAGGADAGLASPDLVRRTSITSSLPPGPAAAPGAAAAASDATATAGTGPSPAKRIVLRAALPAAPVAGDETPPRADEAGDAPYDPDASFDGDAPYDPEAQHDAGEAAGAGGDDMPVYEPYDPSAAPEPARQPGSRTAGAAPSVASLRAAPAAVANGSGTGGSLQERQTSLPSPIRSPAAVVSDLAPVIQRQLPGDGAPIDVPLDGVGDMLWTGVLRVPGANADQLVAVEASYLGGSGRLAHMLRCAEPAWELVVKGQVKLSRVEQFFEELRRSRSRTITLGLVRPASSEAAAAAGVGEQAVAAAAIGGGMAEFVAAHRSRTGLATPQGSLEAYLITRGTLASRLLKTARMVCPPHQLALLPEDIADDQLLLAMVHPKAWEPPQHVIASLAAAAAHSHPHHAHQHSHHGHHDAHQHPPHGSAPPPHLDMAALAQLPLGGGLVPSPGVMAHALPGGVGGVATAADPRLQHAVGPAGPGPLGHGVPPTADTMASSGPGAGDGAAAGSAVPIDLGALSDLAAALGIPGGGEAPGAQAPPPAAAPPPPPQPPPQQQQQLVTMVMQNPDGTLAIVAVPQGQAPPVAPGPGPAPMGMAAAGPMPVMPPGQPPAGPGMDMPPPYGAPVDHATVGPPPGYYPPPSGQHRDAPSPDGLYGPPPGSYDPRGGPPPGPYNDPRGPPPSHHSGGGAGGYPPQGPPDPYYGGGPPPHHSNSGYYREGSPSGPPPPYAHRPPPANRGGGGYPPPGGRDGPPPDDRHYPPPYRGGPPPGGPHDPYDTYRGGPPPPAGSRGPPRGGWGEPHEGPHGGRWGGGRGGGRAGGRGRGGPDEARGGGYGGGRGGRGPPDHRGYGRERDWQGGGGDSWRERDRR